MLRSLTSGRSRDAIIRTLRTPETPLLDRSPASIEVIKYCSNARWTVEPLLFDSYAAIIVKYVEVNSPANVLDPVDLCTCIKAMPSTIWTIKSSVRAGSAGALILFSRTDASSLFITFLTLPSLWTSEEGTGDNSYERISLRLDVCLALASRSGRLNRSQSAFTVFNSFISWFEMYLPCCCFKILHFQFSGRVNSIFLPFPHNFNV